MKSTSKLIRVLALALVFSLLPIHTFAAKSSSELSKEVKLEEENLKKLNDENSSLKEDIESKSSKIDELIQEQESVSEEIQFLDNQIMEIETKIAKLNKEIESLQANIEATKARIEELKIEIEKNTKLFEERIIVMYKNGGDIATLEVLLSSDGVNDFLSRQTMMETLADHDKNLIEILTKDKEELDTLEIELNGQLATLEANRKAVEGQKEELEVKQNEKNILLANLQDEEMVTAEEKAYLEEQTETYAKQIKEKEEEISRLEKARVEASTQEENKRKEEDRKSVV